MKIKRILYNKKLKEITLLYTIGPEQDDDGFNVIKLNQVTIGEDKAFKNVYKITKQIIDEYQNNKPLKNSLLNINKQSYVIRTIASMALNNTLKDVIQ